MLVAKEMLGYSCVVLFIVLVCNTNGREITSSNYLDCNAFDSAASRETCIRVNLYFHEIFETASEEYFWAPYSYSDDIATPRTNKERAYVYWLRTWLSIGKLFVSTGEYTATAARNLL